MKTGCIRLLKTGWGRKEHTISPVVVYPGRPRSRLGHLVNAKDILKTVTSVLVIDWPSKEVPETLARAGFHVVVRGGPGPADYSAYELRGDQVVRRHLGLQPERADLVYSHRPLSELPEIITLAKSLHARAIWTQSGMSAAAAKDPRGCWVSEDELKRARDLVEAAGLLYIAQPYIADVAREIQI
jgi:predicted CoA-binding protein